MNDNVVSLLVSLSFFFSQNQKKKEKKKKEELKKSSAKNQVLHKGAFVCRMKEFMNSNFLHSFKEAVT